MMTRRAFLRTFAYGSVASIATGSYAFAIEPRFRLVVTRYAVAPPHWPEGKGSLRIAALADLHACEPWMPASRIEEIVAATNALQPDVIVLLGDFVAGVRRRLLTRFVHAARMGQGAWQPVGAARRPCRPRQSRLVDRRARGARRARRERHHRPRKPCNASRARRPARPSGSPASATSSPIRSASAGSKAPTICPERSRRSRKTAGRSSFSSMSRTSLPAVPARVSLTLAGHTHGGQVDLPFIGRPIIPSRFGAPLRLWSRRRGRPPSHRVRRARLHRSPGALRRAPGNRPRRTRRTGDRLTRCRPAAAAHVSLSPLVAAYMPVVRNSVGLVPKKRRKTLAK